jgi:hypothetical protein
MAYDKELFDNSCVCFFTNAGVFLISFTDHSAAANRTVHQWTGISALMRECFTTGWTNKFGDLLHHPIHLLFDFIIFFKTKIGSSNDRPFCSELIISIMKGIVNITGGSHPVSCNRICPGGML